MQRIYLSDIEGKPALCFDTGLDPRSFARTKMSQSMIEPGYIVCPDGSHEEWKASGVSEINGSMKVWGPSFAGKRLDLLINEIDSPEQQAEALQAIVFWIRAKMLLGETQSTLNPAAAFVCLADENKYPKGSVFFAPENLSHRCLLLEGSGKIDNFNSPDLKGMDAAAFCTGSMLYKILSKSFPFPHDKTIFQDMREGLFLLPHLAVPGLDKELCNLIKLAIQLPCLKEQVYFSKHAPENKTALRSGTDIIGNLLNLLMDKENNIVSVSSLINELSEEERMLLEKEKKHFLLKQKTLTKTKYYAMTNKRALIGAAVGLLFVIFVTASTIKSFSERPTTAGMEPDTVITVYYDAFSSLDHMLMEACIKGASKTDINAAASFFAIYKTRQVYEPSDSITIIPAKTWLDEGGTLPAPNVFGVTGLSVRYITGSYEDNMIIYRAEYLLWALDSDYSVRRIDTLTLKRDRKDNWRITEILRDER